MENFVIREERYRAVRVREERYEYYMAPPQEDPVKIMLEHFGKQAEQKAFADYRKQDYQQQAAGDHKGLYLRATVVNQGQYQQQPISHKAPHLRTGIAHDGHFQQANMRNQVPDPVKKHGGVMDCNEAAKIYGGVLVTDYGRNKFSLRA